MTRFGASTLYSELDRIATEAGVKQLPGTYNEQDIEGSDSMKMVSVTEGCEGSYASLAKFINLLDKSPRFLIIENLATAAPRQNGGALNVQIKIDTFINGAGGAAMKLGAENKKATYFLAVLMVGLGYAFYSNVLSGPSTPDIPAGARRAAPLPPGRFRRRRSGFARASGGARARRISAQTAR